MVWWIDEPTTKLNPLILSGDIIVVTSGGFPLDTKGNGVMHQ